MRTRTLRATALSVLAACSLVAAACGDDDDDDAGDVRRPPPTGPTAGDDTGRPPPATAPPRPRAATPATTAGGTTPPDGTAGPTAPPRGDADLVIWADDTRQAVVQEIADTFGEENGITVDVQELEFGQIREQLSLAAPAGEGPTSSSAPTTGSASSSPTACVEPLDLSGVADGFQEVAIAGLHLRRPDRTACRTPSRTSPSSATPTSCPRRRRRSRRWSQIATDFKAQNADDPTDLGLALQIGPEGDGYHYQPILTAFGGYIFAQNEDGTFNPDDLGLDSEGGLAAAAVPRRAGSVGPAQRRRHLRRDDPELRRGQGAVRHHRAVGDRPGGQRLRRHRRAVRGDARSRPARAASTPAGVRRRAGLHGLVVLRAEGPRHELRARLHDPGVDAAGAVRGRADVRRR